MSTAIEVVTVDGQAVEPEHEGELPWLHAQVMACGRPHYWCNERGEWFCSVEIPTERAGVTAEVASGFRHPTLSAALRALLERLREAQG